MSISDDDVKATNMTMALTKSPIPDIGASSSMDSLSAAADFAGASVSVASAAVSAGALASVASAAVSAGALESIAMAVVSAGASVPVAVTPILFSVFAEGKPALAVLSSPFREMQEAAMRKIQMHWFLFVALSTVQFREIILSFLHLEKRIQIY